MAGSSAPGDGVLVSVLIPVRDEQAHLRTAAAAMLAQELDGEAEFLFVDGASSDGTVAIVEALAASDPRVRLLHNPRRTTPHGLNVGLEAARGRYVARMDAHTLYPRDYLAQGIRRLRRGDVAHVSGPQLARAPAGWAHSIALALSSRAGTGGARFRRDAAEEFEVDSGFTGVWERDTLRRHGGWDPGWPVNQDAELAARIRAAGGRIVCVGAMAAEYIPRDSLGRLARQYFRYGVYRRKTAARHPSTLRPAHLLPPSVVAAAAGALVPGPQRRPARAALAAYGLFVAASARGAAREEPPAELVRVAAVLVVMHLSWGAGMWAGAVRRA